MMLLDNQWLQFDVGPPTLVTGVVTKGRGDGGKKHWVTRFRLSYSNDSRVWIFYKDASHLDAKVTPTRYSSSNLSNWCGKFFCPVGSRTTISTPNCSTSSGGLPRLMTLILDPQQIKNCPPPMRKNRPAPLI